MVNVVIKEIVNAKFRDNLSKVVEKIINYFGEEHRDQINKRLESLVVSLVEEEGVYSTKDSKIYVGSEPICVKEEIPQIIIPLSFMGDPHGNVVLVHLLLHVVGEDVFIKEHNDAFNEIIVDYMANQIAKQLQLDQINLTVVQPIYESNSFYSRMFDDIKDFYENNKTKIINSRMGKNVTFDEDLDDYIYSAQSIVDSIFMNDESTQTVIKKR